MADKLALEEQIVEHRFEQALAQEAARRLPPEEDEGPPPRSLARAVERHDRDRRRLSRKLLGTRQSGPVLDLRPRVPQGLQPAGEWPLGSGHGDDARIKWLDGRGYLGAATRNTASQTIQDKGPSVRFWGLCGTGRLSGAFPERSFYTGYMDNLRFGRHTGGFGILEPRAKVTVISSVHITPVWLEALSFGKASFGRITVRSRLSLWVDVRGKYGTVDLFKVEERVEPLCGESPRGNWREGRIGAFRLMDPSTREVTQSISTYVDNQPDLEGWVNHEVDFRAERFGRPDRCNAMVEAFVTWNRVFTMVSA